MIQSRKILHVFDDEKITGSSIELFRELDEYDQHFAVITTNSDEWIKKFPNEKLIVLPAGSKSLIVDLRDLIHKYDVIFLQALSYFKARAIVSSKFDKKVFVWGLWGYELYNIFNYYNATEVYNLITTYESKKGILEKVRNFYTYELIYKKAVGKIDICLFLLAKDFELLTKAIPNKAIWISGCYQTIENIYGKLKDFEVQGNSILIGNSSTPSNKHEQVFEKLEKADIKNKLIIVPLSYGDLSYRDKILKQGEKLFTNNFKPLLNFMPIGNYLEEVKTCEQVIMAHERQQAFGSIITMLLGGAKVYLSNASPLYQWFKELGLHIFCVENDLPHGLSSMLTKAEKNENAKILREYLSQQSVLKRLRQVMDTALDISISKTE